MKARTLMSAVLVWLAAPSTSDAESLTYMQVLERVIQTYPTLQAATLQLERARQENARVQSQLGWTLNAQAGAGRDLSIIGTPVDRADGGASINRKLSSGSTLQFGANYLREDTTQTFSPLIPNPSASTGIDLNYRQPLGRGAGNPDYTQGLVSAQAQEEIAKAGRRGAYDDIARQVADVYYAAALTTAQLGNVQSAIDRAEQLKSYIRGRLGLGLAETKDVLQAEAQLQARRAEYQAFVVAWNRQRTNLNRLMGSPPDADFTPSLPASGAGREDGFQAWLDDARRHSPALQQTQAQIALAEAAIELRRDAHKDELDVVFSLAGRTRSGDLPAGSDSQSETIGGVRLEFSRALDQRGLDAELYQAVLDRDIAREQQRLAQEDLKYAIAGLAAEIDANRASLAGARVSLAAEEAKLSEARDRYREGREQTDNLIRFASELSAAEFVTEQQKIDLARRYIEVDVLRGTVWRAIEPLAEKSFGRQFGAERAGKAPQR